MANSARIDELKKKFDENPRRYFASLANEYRKSGDLDQALFICQEYLPAQPAHMSGHIVYAQTLYEMARYTDAKAEFESALALDPENLIALRHLGDIARHHGELREARGWYQRVLEADPRNTEIVDVLASMRTTPMSSFAGISAVPPTPLSTPVTPAAAAPPAPPPAAAPPIEAVHAPTEHELLDLDSLTLGETPLSTQAVSGATQGEMSTQRTSASDQASGGGQSGQEFEDIETAETLEPDALAAAAHRSPDIELSTDINLGLLDDSDAPSASDFDAAPLEGLRSYEPGVIEKPAEPIEKNLETEPFYDVLHGDARSTPPQASPLAEASSSSSDDAALETSDWVPSADAASSRPDELLSTAAAQPDEAPSTSAPTPARGTTPVSSEIFVTETMAELYLQQGHPDSALDIYRKLLEQRPDDPTLTERLRAVEAQMAGGFDIPGALDESISPAAEAGPTIREFLVSLTANGSAGRAVDFSAGESGAAGSTSERGSIDALFGSVGSSTSDSDAATALADAFSPTESEGEMLEGLPTHRATNELSLDQVFKASTSPKAETQPDGFSFDQFFSGEANTTPPGPSSNTSAPPPEGTDDIAQFTAWLNGLKKT